MLSSEAGIGETAALLAYNQVRSLWLALVPQETESGPRQEEACTYLCRVRATDEKHERKNRIVQLKEKRFNAKRRSVREKLKWQRRISDFSVLTSCEGATCNLPPPSGGTGMCRLLS